MLIIKHLENTTPPPKKAYRKYSPIISTPRENHYYPSGIFHFVPVCV